MKSRDSSSTPQCRRAGWLAVWPLWFLSFPVHSAAESGWTQLPQGPGMNAAYLGQIAVALIVVVLAILALAFIMRRAGGMQAGLGRELRVLGGLSVGGRERVALVQVGQTQILVGIAPGRVQTLHVLDPSERIQMPEASTRSGPEGAFAKSLRQMLQKGTAR